MLCLLPEIPAFVISAFLVDSAFSSSIFLLLLNLLPIIGACHNSGSDFHPWHDDSCSRPDLTSVVDRALNI